MSNFKKVSSKAPKEAALAQEDRSKLRGYWSELWGSEYANALVKDYKPEGKKQSVSAKTKSTKKKG